MNQYSMTTMRIIRTRSGKITIMYEWVTKHNVNVNDDMYACVTLHDTNVNDNICGISQCTLATTSSERRAQFSDSYVILISSTHMHWAQDVCAIHTSTWSSTACGFSST